MYTLQHCDNNRRLETVKRLIGYFALHGGPTQLCLARHYRNVRQSIKKIITPANTSSRLWDCLERLSLRDVTLHGVLRSQRSLKE